MVVVKQSIVETVSPLTAESMCSLRSVSADAYAFAYASIAASACLLARLYRHNITIVIAHARNSITVIHTAHECYNQVIRKIDTHTDD
jgi:hypothetical protein